MNAIVCEDPESIKSIKKKILKSSQGCDRFIFIMPKKATASYVRGGIDVLYEKLVEGESTPEAFANRLYDFVDEFNDRFNSEIYTDDILQLCVKKA